MMMWSAHLRSQHRRRPTSWHCLVDVDKLSTDLCPTALRLLSACYCLLSVIVSLVIVFRQCSKCEFWRPRMLRFLGTLPHNWGLHRFDTIPTQLDHIYLCLSVCILCFCFILHSCCIIVSTVGWTWLDWSLILRTYLPSVLWHCWLGHMSCKNRYDLHV